MTVSVAIVDDHAMVREGMGALLASHKDIEVVAEFTSGAEMLAAAPTILTDIVLMDISMAGLNGLDTARKLSTETPHLKIIMVSMHATADYAIQSLHTGASGYLLKKSASEEIGKAIDTVMHGQVYIDSNLSRRALENYMQHLKPGDLPQNMLTTRQREILQLMAEGQSTKEIARTLQLSPKTVETHRALLMDRLNIHDIAGLVRYAIRFGLITAER
ncbi:MAG TPA: response regulator transcription factor [Steroidobacteraceae bacterium]|jgi:DNA-binding NarL/FixJ family response regulator